MAGEAANEMVTVFHFEISKALAHDLGVGIPCFIVGMLAAGLLAAFIQRPRDL